MGHQILTPANIEYIKLHRLTMSGTNMAKHFGVSKGVVNRYMRVNGLAVSKNLHHSFIAAGQKGKTTSDEATDEILTELYLTVAVKTISRQIERSSTFVSRRLKQLGLVIPIELIEERKKNGRFQKGNISFNTGRKQSEYMSPEGILKGMAFRFKKGQVALNAKTDGEFSNRIDRNGYTYRYIRISAAKWELYHRIVWQQANGAIPSDSLVIFKDGNRLNCSLENLELITKRENIIRNRASFLILPTELQTTKRLLTKIKKLTNV